MNTVTCSFFCSSCYNGTRRRRDDMKIMVTGFGPFGQNETNPTKEVLGLLPKSIYGHPIVKVELPVIFDECFDVLKSYIGRNKPDVIIMLGLAGGRTAITPERIAVNLKDARIPDNAGNKPQDEEIVPGGTIAYFSRLPLREIEAALQVKKIPVQVSNSAGLYVCNNIFYHVMNCIASHNLQTKAGFIHVPFMDGQRVKKGAFTMPIDQILEAIIDSIKVVIKQKG